MNIKRIFVARKQLARLNLRTTKILLKIDFDITKSLRNAVKRGLPFDLVEGFDWNTALVVEDLRNDYLERRFQALGLIDDRLYMVVFTPIEGGVRVISLRAASRKERSRWPK
ncbi:BrnT family toxin [Microvirga sp. CF3016]|uniref:BrnT family toxin n=1 Tax=Microvirga sp. CF3016 TaxID=3110181 RepID=UPI002E770679|nr:BrnT family toxin [Microvirga sp. CF3016]MEE1612085.1 BrnT family toxin [Microvirga sp. CF3016]